MESGIGCIAHHHDFVWERERFLVTAAEDFLAAAFPPPISTLQHIAINSRAAREFSRRTGLTCRVIPNIMDFDNPPPVADAYAADFREAIGLTLEDILILQPTRIVQRKGIEHAIELLYLLKKPEAKLVISHASGDEGDLYAQRIRRYAEALKVPVVFADQWIAQKRGTGSNGKKLFTLEDAYSQADFVTYPSTYEGFGNAFLEAVYFKKPLLCNRYAIYRTDIQPCGFDVVLMDGFLNEDLVEQVREVLDSPDRFARIVEHNYEVARKFFSFRRVRNELEALLAKPRLSSFE
jgi:glycosyltransferase involved in cell wall biosynthesis